MLFRSIDKIEARMRERESYTYARVSKNQSTVNSYQLTTQSKPQSNTELFNNPEIGSADFTILCVFDSPTLRRPLVASLRETFFVYNQNQFINQLFYSVNDRIKGLSNSTNL